METADTPVDMKFLQLFRGRGDAYGTWEGGCKRDHLNLSKFLFHLSGRELIGVYPLVPLGGVWSCVWGCSDIDVDDLDAARNLQTAFAVKGIKAWVEKTRKGYHVWVFAVKPVSGAVMRRAFLAAHQAVNYPAKEVNPKQENPGKGYGNYVRLPYPGVQNGMPENRYMLDDDDQPIQFNDFVNEAYATRVSTEMLESIAGLYQPPVVTHGVKAHVSDLDVEPLLWRIGGLGRTLWTNGPKPGRDRSSLLWRLACICKDAGLEPTETVSVIKTADERWGKFHLRINGDNEIINLVERVYSQNV